MSLSGTPSGAGAHDSEAVGANGGSMNRMVPECRQHEPGLECKWCGQQHKRQGLPGLAFRVWCFEVCCSEDLGTGDWRFEADEDLISDTDSSQGSDKG